MKIYDKQFADFESLSFADQVKINAKDLVVKTNSGEIPMLDLFVVEKNGKTRRVHGVLDFKRNLNKNLVFVKEDGTGQLDNLNSPILYKNINIPDTIDSTEINMSGIREGKKIPNGLKRTLGVSPAESGDGEYLYVFIDGKGKFLAKDKIFWIDGITRKTYQEAINEGKNLADVQFIDEFDKDILGIYTEHEYKMGIVIAKEKINLTATTDDDKIPPHSKQTYTIDKNGKITYKVNSVDKYLSDQQYVQQEVDHDKKPGKKKIVSKLKTKNSVASQTGEYVALTVKNELKSGSIISFNLLGLLVCKLSIRFLMFDVLPILQYSPSETKYTYPFFLSN